MSANLSLWSNVVARNIHGKEVRGPIVDFYTSGPVVAYDAGGGEVVTCGPIARSRIVAVLDPEETPDRLGRDGATKADMIGWFLRRGFTREQIVVCGLHLLDGRQLDRLAGQIGRMAREDEAQGQFDGRANADHDWAHYGTQRGY